MTVEFCSSLLIDLAYKFSNISFLKYDVKLNLYHALFITFIIALIGIIIRIKINKINAEKKTA
ncbi:hypothetical protein [Brachyspira sp. G79]|uniref:hypothetical protein n=1 Tax=Brachyspira sp. G79 TaxID=1358104 RepID=UPI000BD25EF9|nr:hypothetical protein [Brachyspira sp. G79]PCG19874.1 hypothetical protein KQ44_07420 [Brachyspira sp. G79]